MATGDKGKLFIISVPLFTLSLLSEIVRSLRSQDLATDWFINHGIGHVRYINILNGSEAFGLRLQIFKASFVPQFPKET